MNITAIGRSEILYNTIEKLVHEGHQLERIITAESSDFYRTAVTDFHNLAKDRDADFLVPDDINHQDVVSKLRSSESEIALSVNWPTLIEPSVLNAFEYGIFNGHAGDLPRYRGNAAPNWAIINGESEVALTIHQMTENLDAGPIVSQYCMPIDGSTYIGDIYDRMYEVFPRLFTQVVNQVASDSLDPQPQPSDPSAILRGFPRKPVDSELVWEESANRLARIVRASAEPLFGAYTWYEGRKLRIWRAHAKEPKYDHLGTPGQVAERNPSSGTVAVVTGEGFLVLESIQRDEIDEDRRRPTDIITSNRSRLGMNVTEELAELRREITELQQRIDGSGDHS